ncbi:hypothetical protein [Thermanaerothrix daxensis]|uniref:hypothetical protein n=1 Tax=Thermanaerothrix daxensis TaxID=869279 RepID=UPI00128F91B6|nr:hypothetical protein [Thermanaerothrix daxensis]
MVVETGLHYRQEVTFREDATRMTKGATARILATVHNVVLALIKQAGHLAQAFALLLSGHSRL